MNKITRIFALTVLYLGLVSLARAEVIGYVSGYKFHPLVIFEGGALTVAKSRSLNLLGELREAFTPGSGVLSVTGQEDYEDAYSDEPGRFGTVKGKYRENAFYSLRSAAPLPSEVPSRALRRSFYEFFSMDSWGRHFAEGVGSKDPATALEKDGSVQILYATDLDSDGKKELWITYRLMYGEIGRMVWEQEGPNGWRSLANHCFNCD